MCGPDLAPTARGFSLPELLLLIVVFAIGLAGVLLVFNGAVAGSPEPIVRKQAMAAAESMLEEVLLMPFANPSGGWSGAATQANRASFDDVQDYNGFNSTGIYAIDGVTPIVGLENYNLSVTVAGTALGSVPAMDSLRVTVTVSGPRISYALDGYKVNLP
jgi:MSHA pilin protein MshD